jgi:hypothetical protein
MHMLVGVAQLPRSPRLIQYNLLVQQLIWPASCGGMMIGNPAESHLMAGKAHLCSNCAHACNLVAAMAKSMQSLAEVSDYSMVS